MPSADGLSVETLREDARDAALVARTEVRRSWRRVADTDRVALKLVALTLVGLVYVGGTGFGGFVLGRVLRTEEIEAGVVGARAGAVLLLAFVGFMGVQRTVKQVGWPDAPAALLTAASPRAVAVGHLAAEVCRYASFLALPLAAGSVGLAIGARSATAGLTVLLVAAALVVGGTALGYVGGLLAKRLAARSAFVARHRTAISLLSAVSIPALYTVPLAVNVDVSLAAVRRATDEIPLAWLGDPAIALVPGVDTSPLRVAVGAALLLALPAGGSLAAGRVARGLWLRESAEQSSGRETAGFGGEGLDRALSGLVDRPVRQVAVTCVRRAVRSPVTVQYAVVPVFFLFYEVQLFAVSGVVPMRLPVTVGLTGAVVTGGLYTLNPIGNEGDVLPATLTTGVGGRRLVAGAAVGELAVGLPLTVLAVAAVAVASPLTPLVAAADVVGMAILCVAGTGVAAAFGTRYPKLEATRINDSREVVVPSPWAFVSFLLAMVAIGLPALVGHLAVTAATLGPPAWTLQLTGLAVSVALGVGAGYVGFRRAVRRADAFRLD